MSKSKRYELTSNFALYHNGKSEILYTGQIFRLAGFELSSHTSYSPFFYKCDIIRLPNAILKELYE